MKQSERRSMSTIKSLVKILIAVCLVFIQLFFYYLLLFRLKNIPGITAITSILSLIIVSYIFNSKRNPSYKLIWTVICFLFSLSGPFLFLLFANGNNLPKQKNNKIKMYLDKKIIVNDNLDLLKQEDNVGYKHAFLLYNNTDGYPLYKNSGNTFFPDGLLMYNDMLEKIKNAQKFIFMEFFIISNGSLFDELFDILKEKALSGVEVRVIYDAIGCARVLKKKNIKQCNQIDHFSMVAYNPFGVNLNLSQNYRDHRKIVVVDGMYSYVGGMNLADEYIHRKVRFGFWRDNGMLIQGSSCYTYTLLFASNWYMSTKKMLLIEDYKPIYEDTYEEGYILPFGDGPTNIKNPTYDLFTSLICNAKKSVYISTPYFIIDSTFIATLIQAEHSGIDVKLLIPAIPDKKMVFQVTLSHLKDLFDSGVEIYEFSKGFNHAKNVVVDGKYAFVGTANVEYRSMFLHFECGNFLINTNSVIEIHNDFLQTIQECKRIKYEDWINRSFINKATSFALTILGPLM